MKIKKISATRYIYFEKIVEYFRRLIAQCGRTKKDDAAIAGGRIVNFRQIFAL